MEQPATVEVEEFKKDMHLAEMLLLVERSLSHLKCLASHFTDLDSLSTRLKTLLQPYFHAPRYQKRIANHMIQLKAPELLSNLLGQAIALDNPLATESTWSATYHLFQCVWNYSDASFDFATALSKTDIPNLVEKVICKKDFKENPNQDEKINYMVKASVSVVHNIVRVPGCSTVFQEKLGLKESLVELATSPDNEFLRCVATLCLAYVLKKDESAKLDKATDAVLIILKEIENASLSKTGRAHGFSVTELLAALSALTMNSSVARVVLDNGGLALLQTLLVPERPQECHFATKFLCNLLDDAHTQKVLREYDAHKLQELTASLQQVQEGVAEMEVLLQGTKKNVEDCLRTMVACPGPEGVCHAWTETDSGPRDQVFVAFAWSDRDTVQRLVAKLAQEGLKCQCDLQNPQGPSLATIAKGVEGASLVILCHSQAFLSSQHCEMVAEYAVKHGKKIVGVSVQPGFVPTSGWLAVVLTTASMRQLSLPDNPTDPSGDNAMDIVVAAVKEISHQSS